MTTQHNTELDIVKKVASGFSKGVEASMVLVKSVNTKFLKEVNFDGIYFRKDIGHQVRNNFDKEN